MSTGIVLIMADGKVVWRVWRADWDGGVWMEVGRSRRMRVVRPWERRAWEVWRARVPVPPVMLLIGVLVI